MLGFQAWATSHCFHGHLHLHLTPESSKAYNRCLQSADRFILPKTHERPPFLPIKGETTSSTLNSQDCLPPKIPRVSQGISFFVRSFLLSFFHSFFLIVSGKGTEQSKDCTQPLPATAATGLSPREADEGI